MASYRARPSRAERAEAIAAVVAIHLAVAALVLGGSERFDIAPQPEETQLVDVPLPPPPPPPPPPRQAPAADREAGKAGKKANPTPIVAPPPRIDLPTRPPVAAAPIAGTGSAPTAGAATAGNGTGAGGNGNGPGGGGAGGAGGGIGEDARLISGGLDRRDYRRLRAFDEASGHAVIGLLVGPDGRVAQCSIRQSSGDPTLDAALCAILQPRMRWAPARDRAGRPLTVGIIYTAIWSRD